MAEMLVQRPSSKELARSPRQRTRQTSKDMTRAMSKELSTQGSRDSRRASNTVVARSWGLVGRGSGTSGADLVTAQDRRGTKNSSDSDESIRSGDENGSSLDWERQAQEWLPAVKANMNDLRRRSRNLDSREMAVVRRSCSRTEIKAPSAVPEGHRSSDSYAPPSLLERWRNSASALADMMRGNNFEPPGAPETGLTDKMQINQQNLDHQQQRRRITDRRQSMDSMERPTRVSLNITTPRVSAGFRPVPMPMPKVDVKQYCKERLRTLVDSKTFSIVTFTLTIYVLFGEDLRLALFHKTEDMMFDVVTCICLLIFTFETISLSLVVDDYFGSFFFFLDVVSTFSLILDLTFIWEYLLVTETEYARAGRSGRMGTRLVRVLRVVKLVRMVRIVKFIKFGGSSTNKDKADSGKPGAAKESRVGKKLSERTTLWVIVLVLAMLLVTPQLDAGEDTEMMPTSAKYGASVVFQAWSDFTLAPLDIARRQAFELQMLLYIYYHNMFATCPSTRHTVSECASWAMTKLCYVGFVADARDSRELQQKLALGGLASPPRTSWDGLFDGPDGDTANMGFIVGSLPGPVTERLSSPWVAGCPSPRSGTGTEVYGVSFFSNDPCPWAATGRLRKTETIAYLTDRETRGNFTGQFFFVFDRSYSEQTASLMNIARGCFIMLVLIVASILFSKDIDILVLSPIERMISKVEILQRHPLEAANLALFTDVQAQSDARRGGALMSLMSRNRKRSVRMLETRTLENTILKLGSLLALGFGEAGTEIIAKNLSANTGEVNAIMPGRVVEAIYGVCNIQDFSFTTVCLQEKTMVFVNQVAEILHQIVDAHLGSPNKNVGEMFLLVWRLSSYETAVQKRIADLSVMSFVQVNAAVHRDHNLSTYREHPALLARKCQYRVTIIFGLHLGRGIEGAVGSEFKIDTSYVSSDVNFAMQLESLAKSYGVNVLMSEALVWAGTPKLASNYRVLDNIKMPSMQTNTRIYTVDLDVYALEVDGPKKVSDVVRKEKREEIKKRKLKKSYRPHKIFASDQHIRAMRAAYPLAFFQDFEKAYLNYEFGEWGVAAEMLRGTLNMVNDREDGPSLKLLDVMAEHDNKAPTDWAGFRFVDPAGLAGRLRRPE